MSLHNDLLKMKGWQAAVDGRIRDIEKGTTETRPAPRFLSSPSWPWYSLRPYLCGGWVDPFSDNEFRRYAPTGTPVDYAGFYDTGQALIFTGAIAWQPDDWWSPETPWNATAAADPLQQGTPPVYKDASQLINITDGYGNGIADVTQNEDFGFPLPYKHALSGTLEFPLSGDKAFTSAKTWTNGRRLDVAPSYRSSSAPYGTIFSFIGLDAPVVDPDGFTHRLPPAADVTYNLTGQIMPYSEQLATPTSFPGYARYQDAYFGVPMILA
jgi:hypothetical protein